jgi:arginine deiminase
MQIRRRDENKSTNSIKNIQVDSEIGQLKSVILKRPGLELENLTPESLQKLLFDDIPFLDVAQKEHDAFSNILKSEGVRVSYLDQLFAESIVNDQVKSLIISKVLVDANIEDVKVALALKEYLGSKDPLSLSRTLMSGIKKEELHLNGKSLHYLSSRTERFWLNPIPNLYFTRDPASVISGIVNINKMNTETRQRESIFIDNILKFHPTFKKAKVLDSRLMNFSIEGGDILILNKNTIAIAISERTSAYAIESIANSLFNNKDISEYHEVNNILVFDIPKTRSFMHLDTVFTQVDMGVYTVHSSAMDSSKIYKVTSQGGNELLVRELTGGLKKILSQELGISIKLINCGGVDSVHGEREQWSDGANTLAIRPGVVCVYNRNKITNRILEDNGIKVHLLPCSELSRGRGGPRCMSMPLERETLSW